MGRYRFDLSSPPNWGPLDRLSLVCATRPTLPALTPSDFMYAGRLVAETCAPAEPCRPVVHLYKHCLARSYVCLDALGHAYRVTMTCHEVVVSIEALPLHLNRYRRPSSAAKNRHHWYASQR